MKGTLSLDEKESTRDREFGRDTGDRGFQLIYDVVGCDEAVKPTVSAGPLKEADENIPSAVLARAAVDALGDEIKVTFSVRHDQIHPGTYGSLLEVKAPGRLTTVRTPVTLSRSEHWWYVPAAIGLVAGAVGFLVFYLTKLFTRYRIIVRKRWFLVAALIACGAGAVSAVLNWQDQDIWVLGTNWKATAVTAFGQSTAGAMAALLAGVFSAKAAPEPDADEEAKDEGGAGEEAKDEGERP